MKLMSFSLLSRTGTRPTARRALAVLLVLAAMAASGAACKRLRRTDTTPLDKAGMRFRSIEELRGLEITDTEVAELVKARQAGLSDAGCIALLRMARERKESLTSGDAVADLLRVNVSEAALLELARLNQLGSWVGEAQAIRLVGLSDEVLLAVARRRAAGQAALSGPALAQLKNVELSEAEILALINRGATDEQAQAIVAAHRRAAGGSGFVRYRRRRR